MRVFTDHSVLAGASSLISGNGLAKRIASQNRFALSTLTVLPNCLRVSIWTVRRMVDSRRCGFRVVSAACLARLLWEQTMSRTVNCLAVAALLWSGVRAGFAQKVNASESKPNTNATELATFGGGCFWCTEAIFQRLPGVRSVASGYAGGKTENPTYEEVCGGGTGHAEVIQVEFEPAKLSFVNLLEVFWHAHDPTTLNRQGADVGTQYRSIILYASEEQKKVAEKSKLAAASQFKDPIVTEIVPLKKFYKAERYHQNYFNNNPSAPYCAFVIRPKLSKVLKELQKQ